MLTSTDLSRNAAYSLLPGPLQHDAMINRAAIVVYYYLHTV